MPPLRPLPARFSAPPPPSEAGRNSAPCRSRRRPHPDWWCRCPDRWCRCPDRWCRCPGRWCRCPGSVVPVPGSVVPVPGSVVPLPWSVVPLPGSVVPAARVGGAAALVESRLKVRPHGIPVVEDNVLYGLAGGIADIGQGIAHLVAQVAGIGHQVAYHGLEGAYLVGQGGGAQQLQIGLHLAHYPRHVLAAVYFSQVGAACDIAALAPGYAPTL